MRVSQGGEGSGVLDKPAEKLKFGHLTKSGIPNSCHMICSLHQTVTVTTNMHYSGAYARVDDECSILSKQKASNDKPDWVLNPGLCAALSPTRQQHNL